MAYKTKQERIEEKTYGLINDVSHEFGLKVNSLPEVYWVGRNLKFEDLGLGEENRGSFNDVKQNKSGLYLYEPKIILLGTSKRGIVGEEAGHFIHCEVSKINMVNENVVNPVDHYSKTIISEMIGYFCAKSVCWKREDATKEYDGIRDLILQNTNVEEKNLENVLGNYEEAGQNYFVHDIGYSLGEELFNNYISGHIPKKQIRNLIKNPFNEDFSATKKLLYLREKFLVKNPRFLRDKKT